MAATAPNHEHRAAATNFQPSRSPASGGRTPRSVAAGTLDIFDPPIACHVLDDGRRVLGARAVVRTLGSGANNGRFARFLARISRDSNGLEVEPISFIARGGEHAGITVEDFQQLLSAITDLAFLGRVHPSRKHIVTNARRLEKALVGVALTALVDEATGFQAQRASDALAQLFKQYLLDAHGEWMREFPEALYEELGRVYRCAYRAGQSLRPRFFSGWTWKYVYEFLPRQVRAELQSRNPNPHEGSVRHHQHLTPPAKEVLRAHLLRLTTVLRQSVSRVDFQRRFAIEFHRAGRQQVFAFA